NERIRQIQNSPVSPLLYTAVLPPEINTTRRKHNQAFITFFNRESQRNAATARENHGQILKDRMANGFILEILNHCAGLCHSCRNGYINVAGDSFRVE